MKRTITATTLATLLVLNSTLGVIAQGETNPMQAGITYFNAVSAGETDVYEYSGLAGEIVSIAMSKVELAHFFSPSLAIQAPDQSVLANANGDLAAHITRVVLPATGIYRVLCRQGRHILGGDYRVTLVSNLQTNAVDSGETNSITAGQTLSGNIEWAADLDAYTYEGTAGESVIIAVSETSDGIFLRPTLRVLAPDGTVAASLTGETEVISSALKFSVSGTYLIVVRDRDMFGGAYNVTLVANPGPNAVDLGEANTIEAGQRLSGAIGQTADMDVYAIELAAWDMIEIRMEEDGIGNFLIPQFYLWVPDGTSLPSSTSQTTASMIVECLQQSGTYLIVCRHSGGIYGGGYFLSLERKSVVGFPDTPGAYLQMFRCQDNLLLRWRTNQAGYILQCTEELVSPPFSIVWSNVPPPYPVIDTFHFITNQMPPNRKFFRLIQE